MIDPKSFLLVNYENDVDISWCGYCCIFSGRGKGSFLKKGETLLRYRGFCACVSGDHGFGPGRRGYLVRLVFIVTV